ncbi:MAG TPA: S1 RNA-binding domain-containing protein [Syntrophorhabdales bacterium]|nr:S1 RNA-binding domain-containing protein [Syntrophorhabdales bacterium]
METNIADVTEPERASEPEESFAELFTKESVLPGRLEPGQKVKTRVISIVGDSVYVDLGGKSEGAIDLAELMADDGTSTVKPGEEIEAFFVSVQHGVRKLTTKIRGYSTLTLAEIRDAHAADLPVTGKVKSEVKGGFDISVGGVRCFCPFSQIDLKGSRDSGSFVGQTFPFKVLEYEEDGQNIILSRRALLEEQRDAEIEKLKATLVVGTELAGTVRSVQSYGAFVDLGGIDGLIPISEMAWGRTEKPEDLLSPGQEVQVKIIGIDWARERLTLSLKALQANPWESVAERYHVNDQVRGAIVRLTQFGAFVNLEPGIDGLIHISALGGGRRIRHPKDVVEVGQWVEAYVTAVDPANKRISLSLQPRVPKEAVVLPEAGDVLEGAVDRVMSFGIFIKLNSGLTGLLPNPEIGTPKGTNHSRMFPEGTKMQVLVKAVDTEKGKISLSRIGLEEKVAQEEFKQYQDSVKSQERASGSLGSLGDLLKAKLNL